ncbi:MAG: alkaline phosphatase family protein [Sphingobacteriales bacterium]|nr:MAG: alkaline phosphatase family protein [Sphingobacteriales bacterium]
MYKFAKRNYDFKTLGLIYSFFVFFIFASQTCNGQNNHLLISGPMPGYTEHREVLIWLEVSTEVNSIAIKYWKQDSPYYKALTQTYGGVLGNQFNPVKIKLKGLDINTTYQYQLILNGVVHNTPYPLLFSTRKLWEWREDPPDFSFIFGSCAYINDEPYDRPGQPYGQSTDIFRTMTQHRSEFMLWVGDNVYLREADWSSEYGIKYRYQHVRKLPELQPFLSSRPNFAIWDDHDFGPNDSNVTYNLKDISLQAFTDYWGNKTFGEAENKGIYSSFVWGDAEFFLLDNRYYRWPEKYPNASENKNYLGNQQMDWLTCSLLTSNARFKFIVSGSQMLNPINDYECFVHYEKEYRQLMSFIEDNQINGVLFLSGDRHLTEIIKIERSKSYPLYDITSSPLTSRPFATINNHKEGNNPNRVPGTLVAEQNFVEIAFKGTPAERKLIISCYNDKAELKWTQEIKASELMAK